MAKSTGKIIGIILILIIASMFFLRTTPFMLAPFGIVSNMFDRVETSLSNGAHFWSHGPFGFPFPCPNVSNGMAKITIRKTTILISVIFGFIFFWFLWFLILFFIGCRF